MPIRQILSSKIQILGQNPRLWQHCLMPHSWHLWDNWNCSEARALKDSLAKLSLSLTGTSSHIMILLYIAWLVGSSQQYLFTCRKEDSTEDSGPSEIGTAVYNRPPYKGYYLRSQIFALPSYNTTYEKRTTSLRKGQNKWIYIVHNVSLVQRFHCTIICTSVL